MKFTKQKHPEVRLKPNSYQPSKAELEADLRVQTSFNQPVKALFKPVKVKKSNAINA